MKLHFVSVLLIVFPSLLLCAATEHPQPPKTAKILHHTQVHGETLSDDYYWLRDRPQDGKSLRPEVVKHLEAENAYSSEMLKPLEPLKKELYQEMVSRTDDQALSAPYPLRDYLYFSRVEKDDLYPRYFRKKMSGDKTELLLDVNKLADGRNTIRVIGPFPSPDQNHIVYSLSVTGKWAAGLYIKNLESGHTEQIREDATVLFAGSTSNQPAAWSSDGRYLYYALMNGAQRPYQIYRHSVDHTVGAESPEYPEYKDLLIYEERNEDYFLSVSNSSDGKWILLNSHGYDSTEFRFIPADGPSNVTGPAPQLIAKTKRGHSYYVDANNDQFYIRTNFPGPNFRLVTTPIKHPQMDHWKPFDKQRPQANLEAVVLFNESIVRLERQNTRLKLYVFDLLKKIEKEISFPDEFRLIKMNDNWNTNSKSVRIFYESYFKPRSIQEVHLKTGSVSIQAELGVKGAYDPSQYEAKRLWATARDGTRVPISLVYKKQDFRQDGSSPILATAYGNYGYSMPFVFDPYGMFSVPLLSLLDRGVAYALVHPRGGGELGEQWHLDGKLKKKKNTFTDFEASLDYLIRAKYAAPDKIVIQGLSAGGLLVGWMLNERPDLVRAAVSNVPFVDILNTMLDSSLPLVTEEYSEWGNPNMSKDYFYIKSYSPYNNVRAHHYPPLLCRVAVEDTNVPYWEGAKWVAKIREQMTAGGPILLNVKMAMAGGHIGTTGKYSRYDEDAEAFAFALSEIKK